MAIVNRTFARRFFPHLNPIGMSFRWGIPPKPVEVVGLMEDSKIHSLREETCAIVSLALSQMPTD